MVVETKFPGVYAEEVPGRPKIVGVGVGVGGFVGRTKKGPTDRAIFVTSLSEFEATFGKGYNPLFGFMQPAIKGYFEEDARLAAVARAAASDAAKAQGTLVAYGVGATAGTVLSSNTQNFNLEPGQTLVINPDAGGNQTVTFAATAATRAGSGATFGSIVGAETLLVAFSGGEVRTVIFQAADTTAAAVAARINAMVTGGFAVVNGAQVDLTSDQKGTGASVQITGGTGLALIGHSIGTTSGTGDVANIDAVTAAEAVTKINAATTGLTALAEGGKVRLSSDTTGALSSIQVINTSTATAFGFDNVLHSGSAAAAVNALTVKAHNVGAWGNDVKVVPTRWSTTITATLSNGGTSIAVASVRGIEPGDLVLIVDPANSNFTIVHVYSINATTKVLSFRACSLSIPGTPLASGSTASSSSMHRRNTQLASSVLSGVTDLPLKNALGIVIGAHVTIDDGTNFKEGIVVAVNGNTIRLNSAISTNFSANVMVATQEFRLEEFEEDVSKKVHEYLSMEEDNAQDYVVKRLSGEGNESKYRIEVVDLAASPTPLVYRTPRPQSLTLTGGADGSAPSVAEIVGVEDPPSGLHLFDDAPQVNRFCAPGITDASWIAEGANYAKSSFHKASINFYHTAPLTSDTVDELLKYRLNDTNQDESRALLYAPWLYERDPNNSKLMIAFPPEGRVLGLVASTASRRGVHVAAANVQLHNVLGLTAKFTDGHQSLLNGKGVNLLRSFPGRGVRIWGARTCQSVQDGLHWQPVREFLNFIKLSVIDNMQFAVFLPNNVELWSQVESTVKNFLSGLWKSGQLFPSDDEEKSYFVKCDAETNTAETVAAGQVICEVGVNLPPPAEAIIFNIGVWDGGTSVEEAIRSRL